MKKLKFIMVVERNQLASVAASMIGCEIRKAVEEGYVCSGSMLIASERKASDSFTQTVLIQPMILGEEK